MADFLTRLIERSRDLATREPKVEPLIAPLYAVGPNTALPADAVDDVLNEDLTSRAAPASRRRTPASRSAEAPLEQQPAENIASAPLAQRLEPSVKVTPEIKPAQAPAGETPSARLDQTPGSEPAPQTIMPKFPLSPANERAGLATTAADQSRRADHEPLLVRPQAVARAADSNARDAEVTNDNSAPVIRVTIGRIDVRAVAREAPPARRATAPAPKLSLEEYLRSRSGRK